MNNFGTKFPARSSELIPGFGLAVVAESGGVHLVQLDRKKGIVSKKEALTRSDYILDFALAENALLLCSGRGRQSSLIGLRPGHALSVSSFTDSVFKGIHGCWGLKKHFMDESHCILALSNINSTTFLHFNEGQVEDATELSGLLGSVPSLAIGNLDVSGMIAQVYPGGIVIGKPDMEEASTEPKLHLPTNRISVAAIQGYCIACFFDKEKKLKIFSVSVDICMWCHLTIGAQLT